RPVVQGIAPALAGGAEVVRRHARHDRGLALRIQQVLRAVGPDLRRVVRDEDRRVADDAHAARMRMAAQALPLLYELPLHETPETDLFGSVLLQAGEGRVVAPGELGGPAVPGRAVTLVERHEQGVVAQPVALPAAKVVQQLAVAVPRMLAESLPRFAQQRHAPRRRARVVGAFA